MLEHIGIYSNKTLYCGMGKFKLFLEGDKLFLHDEGARYTYVADRQEKDFLPNFIGGR